MPCADFADIFSVDTGPKRDALWLELEKAAGTNLSQEEWRSIFRGELLLENPLLFRRAEGSRAYDLIGSSTVTLMVVSGRLVNVLKDGGFTGWGTYPVRVFGRGNEELKGYVGLSVTGRSGRIDRSLSQRAWREPAVPHGGRTQIWRGMYFQPDTWDGSDVFAPEGTSFVLVVGKVRAALERAGLTNLSFSPVTEMETYILPSDGQGGANG